MTISTEQRREWGLQGKLASLLTQDPVAHAAMMRSQYRRSFLLGHGGPSCAVCPRRKKISQDLPEQERMRQAKILWRLHWLRMGQRRRRLRRRAPAMTSQPDSETRS